MDRLMTMAIIIIIIIIICTFSKYGTLPLRHFSDNSDIVP